MFTQDVVRRMLFGRGRQPSVDIAKAIVEAQRETLFVPPMLSAGTRHIDPQTASIEELETALHECDFYYKHCYPETENELVAWLVDRCMSEIKKRYARHGTTIMQKGMARLPFRSEDGY